MIDPTALHAACSVCPIVEAAWISHDCEAFAIQAVVGRKRTRRGAWEYVEPVYATDQQMAPVHRIAARFRGLSFVVPYVWHPGSWPEVYRRRS